MAKRRKTDKEWLSEWKEFGDNIDNATPIDLNESSVAKLKRIAFLEANDEEWFKYYFPLYYKDSPAVFHLESSKKVMNNPELYLVRSWSREFAKSVRTMMEVLKLILTGKKKNILLVSNSYDNAERLLMPFMSNLERNNRIIADYGTQKKIGSWAVLIDFPNSQYSELASANQLGNVQISFQLVFAAFSQSWQKAPLDVRKKGLEYLDIEQKLHKALQGWNLDYFTKLSRISIQSQNNNDVGLRVRNLTYLTEYEDYSTDHDEYTEFEFSFKGGLNIN